MKMIKIDKMGLEDIAEEHYQKFFIGRGFVGKLENLYIGEGDPCFKRFFKFLYKRNKDLIMGTPDVISEIVQELNETHQRVICLLRHNSPTQEARRMINSRITSFDPSKTPTPGQVLAAKVESIFDYDALGRSPKNSPKWNLRVLAEKLRVNVCPYCNRQFTFTYYTANGTGGTRPEFDHFYNRAGYPYLAVSFFNLVPSCHVCNANFKGKKQFSNHLNPYDVGFDDDIVFTVKRRPNAKKEYLEEWYKNPNAFDIDFIFKDMTSKKSQQASRNVDDLCLREMYAFHKDHVLELLVKAQLYTSDKIDSLMRDFPHIFPTRESVLRIITSNYVTIDDLGLRVLSKLTRDVCIENGIL